MKNISFLKKNSKEINNITTGKGSLEEEVFKDDDIEDMSRGEGQRLWKQLTKEQNQGFFKLKDFISPEHISEFNLMLL